jgi:hypothetical protein
MDNFNPTATCVALNNIVTIANALDGDINAGTIVKLQFPNVRNPVSDDETDRFVVQTISATGNLIDEDSNNLTVRAQPGLLDSMVVEVDSTLGNQTVGANSVWKFTIDPNHETPSNGKLKIYFPLWNRDLNPPSTRYMHFISTGGVTCSGVSGQVNSDIPCSYNQADQFLTLTDVWTSVTTASFTILIDPIKNPPSGKEMAGFQVRIMNNVDGTIDISDGTSGIQVATPNNISIATSKLVPLTPTAGSDSIWQISFTSSNPFGAGYEVEVEFPDKLVLDDL